MNSDAIAGIEPRKQIEVPQSDNSGASKNLLPPATEEDKDIAEKSQFLRRISELNDFHGEEWWGKHE